MKSLTCTAIAAALILTMPACNRQPAAGGNDAAAPEAAATDLSVLNGTWKVDLASLKFEQKPDEFLLKDGTYTCVSCIGSPITVPADGKFHPVKDRPYFDSMAVKVVDDKTIEIRRRKGDKEVVVITSTVSADGNSLTNKFHDATTPNAPAIDGTGTSKRVGPTPAGAHAISGQWQPDQIGEYSEDALNITYAINGDTVKQSSQGQSYTAEIGGPAVAVQGDIAGTMVAVAREGSGLKETYTRDGKEVGIATISPNADGKSFSYSNTDPRDGSKVSFTSNKTS